ncbi:MAG TPA: hypothetical protein VGB55_08530 [Tepidisphaeraceae bacterium]|jgi:hypothetical protein
MHPPMIGTWQAVIRAVRFYTIHSDEYFEFQIARTDSATTAGEEPPQMILRAPSHAFAAPPAEGQTVEITFLMGQVTGVKTIA